MLRATLVATLLAGTLDILAAIGTNALRGVPPIGVLQSVASGLLGRDAYAGGATTAALGLALHYLIMLAFAGAFMLAFVRLRAMRESALAAGALYGVAVYAFMNWGVLPLSAFPHVIDYTAARLAVGIAVHITCVGLPIAAVARRS